MGFTNPINGDNDVFGAGGNWPTSIRPGDECWCFVVGIDTPATAMTAPAGWTQIGPTTNWTTSNAALFKHTYAGGDTFPAFSAWKGGASVYTHAFVIRSSGTYTIQTDTVQTGTVNASLQGTVKKFSPADAANDLRILLAAVQGAWTVGAANLPTVTASDNNPTGKKMEQGLAVASSATAMESFFRGYWADPSGLDANDGVFTFTNSVNGRNYFLRSICLTDGTGAGGFSGDEIKQNQADPGILADAMQGNEQDALAAAAGHYVGGARLL